MRVRASWRMRGRRVWPVVLTGAVLLVAGPSSMATAVAQAPNAASASRIDARAALARRPAVAGIPSQVIDSQSNPDQAAAALNSGCADLTNCTWQADTQPTIAYGPSKILGDVLYNCTDPVAEPQAQALTSVNVSDQRSQTTSISETVSLKISLGFLDLENTSAEFKLFSSQSETFSTAVSVTNSVPVPPGYKGWTETQVLTASVTGSAFITQGINKLIQVTNIDLDFPGFQDPNDGQAQIIYNNFSALMTAADLSTRCDPIDGLGAVRPQPQGSFKITLCRIPADDDNASTDHPGGGSSATQERERERTRCASRKVIGPPPPTRIRYATVILSQGGSTYATGTDIRGSIRLNARHPIKAGAYTLTLRERPTRDAHGRTLTTVNTVISVRL